MNNDESAAMTIVGHFWCSITKDTTLTELGTVQ